MFNPKDPEESKWFRETVLKGGLFLYSNELGDTLGPVRLDAYTLVQEVDNP